MSQEGSLKLLSSPFIFLRSNPLSVLVVQLSHKDKNQCLISRQKFPIFSVDVLNKCWSYFHLPHVARSSAGGAIRTLMTGMLVVCFAVSCFGATLWLLHSPCHPTKTLVPHFVLADFKCLQWESFDPPFFRCAYLTTLFPLALFLPPFFSLVPDAPSNFLFQSARFSFTLFFFLSLFSHSF